MPNIKSAKKRVRVIATKTALNKAVKTNLKTMIKKADAAAAGSAEERAAALRAAQQTIDKACAKGVLHRKTAARRKSRLAKSLAAGA